MLEGSSSSRWVSYLLAEDDYIDDDSGTRTGARGYWRARSFCG